MNRIRPFVALLLLFSLALSMSACRPIDTQTHMPSAEHPLTYLVLGFDDAAENTDVMFLVAFDPETPRTAIIQIPRDTYLSTGYAQNKINQIFASRRAAGDTERDALAYVRDLLSGTLGIPLTATVGISMSAFRRTVDAIGGVDMTLTEDIVLDTEDGREPLVRITSTGKPRSASFGTAAAMPAAISAVWMRKRCFYPPFSTRSRIRSVRVR